ncbi:MAG: hypothetical protein R2707_16690 [Acidimicrobiales bacterium]
MDSDAEKIDLAVAAALGRQAIADFLAKGDPFAIRHQVQITSFGGSGTTALTRSFAEAGLDLPPGPAQWPHKHLRCPPTVDEVPAGFRVVYPVGDPRDAVLSVFRRGIQDGHWRGLHQIDPATPTPDRLADLESFLAAGVDDFALAEHFEGWRNHPSGYPVMFVRFDLIDEAWDELATFVGLPDGHPRLTYRARASDWTSTPPEIRERLDVIYGEFAALIDSLPAVQVV